MTKRVYNVTLRISTILCLSLFFSCPAGVRQRPIAASLPIVESTQQPDKVTVCQLQSDPAKYNHKIIEVTGFISHGFEDFGFFNPDCSSQQVGIWLEYGGTTV